MSHPLTSAPLEPGGGGRDGYAQLTRTVLTALVRVVPDAQSAILVVLTWHALRNARLKLGPLAGRTAAGVSGEQLAEALDRPLRTIRHALARLVATRAVVKDPVLPGHKNVYTLPWLTGGGAVSPPRADAPDVGADDAAAPPAPAPPRRRGHPARLPLPSAADPPDLTHPHPG